MDLDMRAKTSRRMDKFACRFKKLVIVGYKINYDQKRRNKTEAIEYIPEHKIPALLQLKLMCENFIYVITLLI